MDAVESIKVVKNIHGGTETRWYWVPDIWVGNVVVRTTVDCIDIIVDPQTDIVLAMEGFAVLYKGEITQDWARAAVPYLRQVAQWLRKRIVQKE